MLLQSFAAIAALVSTATAHVYIPADFKIPESPVRANSKYAAVGAAAANECKLASSALRGLSEGFTSRASFAPSLGTLRANMMFVDFEDAPATDPKEMDTLYNHLLPAAQWFATSSYGKLNLTIDADKRQFYRMPSRSDSYGWSRGAGLKMEQYIRDASKALGAKSQFKESDVFYIVPTKAAKAIWFSPTSMGAYTVNGVKVGKCVTFGQDMYSWGYQELNHETGHTLGLPDLYPSDGAGKQTTHWVGGFDTMGLINGASPDYLAWHKWKLDWLSDDQIACVTAKGTSKHTITPLEVAGTGIKAAAVKLSATKAFVVEVRTQAGVNKGSCSQGLLAYIINTQADRRNTGPAEVVSSGTNVAACDRRSGKLSGAAVNFAKGGKTITSNGVTVTIDGVKEDGSYDITVVYA